MVNSNSLISAFSPLTAFLVIVRVPSGRGTARMPLLPWYTVNSSLIGICRVLAVFACTGIFQVQVNQGGVGGITSAENVLLFQEVRQVAQAGLAFFQVQVTAVICFHITTLQRRAGPDHIDGNRHGSIADILRLLIVGDGKVIGSILINCAGGVALTICIGVEVVFDIVPPFSPVSALKKSSQHQPAAGFSGLAREEPASLAASRSPFSHPHKNKAETESIFSVRLFLSR